MPSSHIKTALVQLREKFEEELRENNIDVGKIKTLGTCRRLVILGHFSPQQKDREQVVVGPPKHVAYSKDGSFTPAAKGFAKSQGASFSQLELIETKKGEYLGLKKIEAGKPTIDILQKSLSQIISSLTFPKMMRWGKSTFKFSRPIRNILCLFDGKILSFTSGGVTSTNFTTGHKIYFPQKIIVKSFSEYESLLKKKKVIVSQDERREKILNQIERKLAPLEAQLLPDKQLLEQLSYDVEQPYVFLGKFPEEYLKLPLEVLSTAMKEGQNLFSVVKGKKQLAYFVGVADAFKDAKGLIRKGNERVLIARLEDARFFWEQDRKIKLKKRAKGLDRIIFQEELGTYEDKVLRLKKIVTYLARKLDVENEKRQLIQAAELCKVDLLTEMVREFSSLQGRAGGLYAREEGYPSSICKAVYEHYQPVSLDDESPPTLAGAILSISDKLDSTVGTIGIGIQATGSKDPFGLRRNAQGICKIILGKKLSLSFSRLLDKVLGVYGEKLKIPVEEVKNYCFGFFSDRLQYIFERQGYRYDLIKAALGAGIDNIYYSGLRIKALDSLKESPKFGPLILISKRVNNILRNQPLYRINPELVREKEERELYTTLLIIKENVLSLISKGDFSQAQRILFRIRSSIDNFFDHVLVMDENPRIRRNRLALLQEISKLFLRMADYSQVVFEGGK
ncbi:MAG: glycine--tRNA ligase subunit beta [Candidatus Aminicenantes bacterium]|nr:glycine--tRNA ligase subunit beta [Candidatus Aminicenantes bacterium]